MPLSPLRLRLLVISLLTVSFLGALDHTVVSTSLATVAGELGALKLMSWVVVGYTLASTVLLPVLGKLGDVLGARRIFLGSLVMYEMDGRQYLLVPAASSAGGRGRGGPPAAVPAGAGSPPAPLGWVSLALPAKQP